MAIKPLPETWVFGIDIGKKLFHLAAANQAGEIIQRCKYSRDALLTFLLAAPRVVIGMEACPGSQWLARKLLAMGHTPRIMSARFVKPYVKSNKTDIVDAAAIVEAVMRPSMRFVELRTPEQIDLQAHHRVRDRIVAQRTGLINQARAFCLEYGLPMRVGTSGFHLDIRRHLNNQDNDLTPDMRVLLEELLDDLAHLERRLKEITARLETVARQDDTIRRLLTIPGIGPLNASALVAAAGDGRQFRKARDMAAWLGLVPAEHSTGGRQKLLGISKRGNRYVRRLIVHGARSCFLHLNREHHALGRWLSTLEARTLRNKAIVALANKLTRIAWAILTQPGAVYQPTKGASA